MKCRIASRSGRANRLKDVAVFVSCVAALCIVQACADDVFGGQARATGEIANETHSVQYGAESLWSVLNAKGLRPENDDDDDDGGV